MAWLQVLKRLVPGGVQRKPYIDSASLQLYGIQDEEIGKCTTTTTKSDSVISTTAALSMALLNVEHFGCQLGIWAKIPKHQTCCKMCTGSTCVQLRTTGQLTEWDSVYCKNCSRMLLKHAEKLIFISNAAKGARKDMWSREEAAVVVQSC